MSDSRLDRPMLDFRSFAKRGPAQALSPAQLEQIRRTVSRTPEVVVKVLPQSAATTGQVGAHVDYVKPQRRSGAGDGRWNASDRAKGRR